jgi:hypothetical protein
MTNQTSEIGEDCNENGERAAALAGIVRQSVQPGQVPLKVVTGRQTTSGLSFELQPGAIVAHQGASVIFVCG